MLYNAKNGTIKMDGTGMDYIRFGTGRRVLVMLPGLGDSLRSMKGTALPMALMYRMFAKDFTVYVFSRKQALPRGCTVANMARDQARAMTRLGIEKADVFGVSMGGMIAQRLAIEYPEKVDRLILAVTAAEPNPVLEESVTRWMEYAEAGDHTAFMASNLERIYSESYCRKNRWMVPLLGKLTKPKSYEQFFIQAEACLGHNALDRLHQIQAPTLVIGGEKDKTLGAESSRQIARRIPGAQLYMYECFGHGVYEEAKDFNERVLDFLRR